MSLTFIQSTHCQMHRRLPFSKVWFGFFFYRFNLLIDMLTETSLHVHSFVEFHILLIEIIKEFKNFRLNSI